MAGLFGPVNQVREWDSQAGATHVSLRFFNFHFDVFDVATVLRTDVNLMLKLKINRPLLWLAATTSMFPIGATAENSVSTPAAQNPLEEVIVTASRRDQTINMIAASVASVADIADIGATHINETMQRTTGVWISRGNGQENLTAIRSPVLTGAGGCGAFLTAQDGIPLRASGFCNVNELFDSHSEQAQRIEVFKGPGSVWYGSNALHGMINIISLNPDGKNSIAVEGGPHDYARTKIRGSSDNWRVDTTLTHDGGYKHDSGYDQQKVSAKALGTLAGFDAVYSVNFTNLNQETAGFIRGNKAYEDGHASRQNPNPEAYRDSQAVRAHVRLTKTLDSGTSLAVTPYVRATEMEFLQHFLPGQAIEQNAHQSVGLQSSLTFDRLTVGIDLETTQGELEEFQPNPTVGSPFLVGTIPAGQHYDYEVDASTIAVFANYSYDFNADTRLDLGARAEKVSYDYNNKMLAGRTRDDGTACGFGGCRFSRPADRDDDFNHISPQLSLLHNFNEAHQSFIRVARGYRAPQATELYRLQGTQTVSNIDAEELDSFEIGIRGRVEQLDYNLALFTMRKDNFIFRDSNRQTVDNGETSHEGLEIQLAYRWSAKWSADFVANFARHQYENNPDLAAAPIKGNDIDTAPKRFGSARVKWQPTAKVSTELEWIHLGSYYTDPQNTAKYDGHDLLNLRLNYAYSDSIALFARLMNLGKEAYAERADFAFGSDRYFVGEPASVYAGFTASF